MKINTMGWEIMKAKKIDSFLGRKVKIFIFLCCIATMVNCVQVDAVASEYVDLQGIEYVLNNDGTCYICACENDNIETIKIPEEITFNGKKYVVTEIKGSFVCEKVTSISIPSTVTLISFVDNFGFYNFYCPQLVKMVVDTNNPSYCSDENGWLYNKDKTILYNVPDSVTKLVIPDGVKKMQCALACSNLIEIVMPNSIETIEKPYGLSSGIFTSCSKLLKIKLSDNLTGIPQDTFAGCSSLTEITIPSKVEYIGEGAFFDCSNLKSINISDSVKEIREGAFCGCTSLASITLPPAVMGSKGSYGAGIFEDCSNLEKVVMKSGTIKIGTSMFEGCIGLKSISLPETVSKIESQAFYGCTSLQSINIPEIVNEIGTLAFGNCTSLKSIKIPKNVRGISASAFPNKITIYGYRGSEAEKIVKQNSAYINYDQKFVALDGPEATGTTLTVSSQQCKVKVTSSSAKAPTVSYTKSTNSMAKTITIPDTVEVDGITYKVTSVTANALANNKKITKVTVGKNVTSIGKNAFKNCTKLKTVTLKSTSLKSIGSNAFYGDKNLKTITIKSAKLTSKSVGKNAFKGTNKKLTIKVPKKKVSSYKKFLKKKGNKKITVKKG